MRNSSGLPIAALAAAAVLAAGVGLERLSHARQVQPLSEIEIALAAWAFVLALFGLQGLISILLEGTELRPGRIAPRLTGLLSGGIVALSVLLTVLALALGGAILTGQSVAVVGTTAGAGCLVLALLLVAYKEALLGDEVQLDARKDGIPW